MNLMHRTAGWAAAAAMVVGMSVGAAEPEIKDPPKTAEERIKALEQRIQDLESTVKELRNDRRGENRLRQQRDPFGPGFNFPDPFEMGFPERFGPRGNMPLGNKPRLGVELAPVSEDLTARFKNEVKDGAFVMNVVPGSPAEKAGVAVGDAITGFDATAVKDPRDLIEAVQSAPQGKHELTITRKGESVKFSVDLAGALNPRARPDPFGAADDDGDDGWVRREPARRGNTDRTSRTEVKASALELTDAAAKELKLTPEQKGKMETALAKHRQLVNEEVNVNVTRSARNGMELMTSKVNELVEKHARAVEGELQGTLSEEQLTAWNKYRRENNSVQISHSMQETTGEEGARKQGLNF